MINIVCSTDHNYIMQTGVMIKSLSINNQNEDLDIYILIDKTVDAEKQQKLRNTITSNKHNIVFLEVPDDAFDGFPGIGKYSVHVSQASYYRLVMAQLLPENVEKVIYLDVDIVIRHSIRDLWTTNIENFAIGCIVDFVESFHKTRVKYDPAKGYFNAGILLINLKYWREHNIQEKFLSFMANNADLILCHDQDVLNYVLCDSKKNIPITYNCQTYAYLQHHLMEIDIDKYGEEIDNTICDPIILHYCTGDKPWIFGCKHPLRKEWFKYLAMTEWKEFRTKDPKTSLSHKIGKAFRKCLGLKHSDEKRWVNLKKIKK